MQLYYINFHKPLTSLEFFVRLITSVNFILQYKLIHLTFSCNLDRNILVTLLAIFQLLDKLLSIRFSLVTSYERVYLLHITLKFYGNPIKAMTFIKFSHIYPADVSKFLDQHSDHILIFVSFMRVIILLILT